MTKETFADARDSTVRERIRLRLPQAQRDDFDAIMAWEDEMLAFATDMAARLDALHEFVAEIAEDDWYSHGADRTDVQRAARQLLGLEADPYA